jgi:hypothetical protein
MNGCIEHHQRPDQEVTIRHCCQQPSRHIYTALLLATKSSALWRMAPVPCCLCQQLAEHLISQLCLPTLLVRQGLHSCWPGSFASRRRPTCSGCVGRSRATFTRPAITAGMTLDKSVACKGRAAASSWQRARSCCSVVSSCSIPQQLPTFICCSCCCCLAV